MFHAVGLNTMAARDIHRDVLEKSTKDESEDMVVQNWDSELAASERVLP